MNKKKANMAYWDSIDDLANEYVINLMSYSQNEIPMDEDEFAEKFDEDIDEVIMELGKEITEFATKLLEERLNAEFPYVDENY